MSLILQLQRDATDGVLPVSQLLRRAIVAAHKLKLDEFGTWLQCEQAGYPNGVETPEYRTVHVIDFKVENPYRGWTPVQFADPKIRELVSEHPVRGSISSIETMIEHSLQPDGVIYVKMPPEFFEAFPQPDADPLDYTNILCIITPTSLQRITDTVRDTILKWTLELESRGVLGEEFSFSEREKEAASHSPQSVSYFSGTFTNAQFQVSSPQSQQYMQVDDAAIDDLKGFIETFAASLTEAQLGGEVREELEAELSTLQAQANSPKPKPHIIVGTLQSIRGVLENAAGSALATAAMPTVLALIDRFGG